MWVTCAICQKDYVDSEYITDIRTYNICDKCYRAGYRLEFKTTGNTTTTKEPNETT